MHGVYLCGYAGDGTLLGDRSTGHRPGEKLKSAGRSKLLALPTTGGCGVSQSDTFRKTTIQ